VRYEGDWVWGKGEQEKRKTIFFCIRKIIKRKEKIVKEDFGGRVGGGEMI
jgi:hypothetical protein